jgi:DNA-binding NtrC family response regulator
VNERPESGPASEDEEVVLSLDAGAPDLPGDAKVALLNRVRRALREAPDLERLLAGIVETVRAALGGRAERVRVELVEGDRIRASAGHDERADGNAEVPVSATVRSRVLGERRSLLVADAAGAFAGAGSVRRLRIGSLLAVPLLGRDEPLGAVFAYHAGDRAPFSRSDLELATALAGLLAYEVESRRLRESLARENEELRARAAEVDLVAGSDPETLAMLRAAEKAAGSDLSVLLVGESGTGKERLAQSIHRRSARAKGPFVAVDCGAIPRELIESELFGHLRGSFTGASRDRTGRFVEADGGTLFLDEIGNLPLEMQPALLRALESMRVTPVGSDRPREVDIRVIAATNAPLRRLASEGKFRQDLYYRLAVLEIDLPPLRHRIGDLPILVDAFLKAAGARGRRFEPSAIEAMTRYGWPGNLRELRNLVWRAATLADGPSISVGDLPPEIRAPRSDPASPSGVATLEEAERRAIEAALRAAGGNKTRAAALLGIARDTLYRKLHGPDRPGA